jgi:hypothetical protein
MVGFGVIAAGIRWLNEGRPVDVGGLFADQGRDDWPHGVQEPDAPRFRVDRADRLRRSADTFEDLPGSQLADRPREQVTWNVRRFVANR